MQHPAARCTLLLILVSNMQNPQTCNPLKTSMFKTKRDSDRFDKKTSNILKYSYHKRTYKYQVSLKQYCENDFDSY